MLAAARCYGQIEAMCQPTPETRVAVPLVAKKLTPVLDGLGKI